MNLSDRKIRQVFIKAGIVLRQPGAEPDGLPQRHMMQIPMRQPGPRTDQRETRSGQRRSQKIILAIPISKIAPMQNKKDSLWIVLRKIHRRADAIRFVPSAPAATISPKVTSGP